MMKKPHSTTSGQALVIFAVTLLVLLFFIGLAVDAGSLYITYGSLKRATDAAALAAVNEFKRDPDLVSMEGAASEVFNLMGIDYSNLEVLLCDMDRDNIRDTGLPPMFELRCPITPAENARKLVWVEAEQDAPLYFLSMMGFNNLTLRTNSITEAAPLDVVIVLDTSESMASETCVAPASGSDHETYCGSDPTKIYSPFSEFDPSVCNAANRCYPMRDAKDAAKALIDSLAPGYDQVAVVTYDRTDNLIFGLNTDLVAAKIAIDNLVVVHDDPPVVFNIWSDWYSHPGSYNPVNSEDLDGDGEDTDDFVDMYGVDCPFHPTNPALDPPYLLNRWWSTADGAPDPFGWGGVPCDRDDRFDSMDWNGDGIWTEADHTHAVDHWPTTDPDFRFSGNSTCIGCGVRQGANQLRGGGRFGSVWVMVFLTDGAANLSDLPNPLDLNNPIPVEFVNGFCGGPLDEPFWTSSCFDNKFNDYIVDHPTLPPRYCFDDDTSECPPDSTPTTLSPFYSVLDYAMDMVDEAALTSSTNVNEPLGNEMAIYAIRLGSMTIGSAEYFMRYMAAVGDDGDRTTDPCYVSGVPVAANTSCGQYYNAPSGLYLAPIFEDIASRIYIKITQ
ncbi:MAG: pilus assembly protein TadG-related protein [Anaerolineaceae bacterium]|nr:pilus assembly protein TadG-related protein [Anaerolineaceae bacterium]